MRDFDTTINAVNETIDANMPDRTVRILEAGCGSLSRIRFPESKHITGIDISTEQLDKNQILDDKILGDIQDPVYFSKPFDLIVCWDVLEHVDQPEAAMRNFSTALTDGGLLVIKVPNIRSLKGIITRFTPHWFHVFAYKYVFGKKDAGQPGCAPFPTTMRAIIAPPHMRKHLASLGLEEALVSQFDALPISVRNNALLRTLYFGVADLLSLVTGGRFGGRGNTDFVCAYRQPAA